MNRKLLKPLKIYLYRKKIKDLIRKAALKELTEKKNTLSKIRELKYETLKIQPYLKCPKFHRDERKLLYALRSRMHPSKNNFRKMYPKNYNDRLVMAYSTFYYCISSKGIHSGSQWIYNV